MSKKKALNNNFLEENKKLKLIFESKKHDLGIKQADLAELLNVTPVAVSYYLNGVNALNLSTAYQFAKILNVNIEEFSPRLAEEIRQMMVFAGAQQDKKIVNSNHIVSGDDSSATMHAEDNSTQTLNASNVGVQIGRDNYGDVSNIKVCETMDMDSDKDGDGFKAVKPLPLLDIDDAVEWILNPHIRADKIKDINERVATYIDHSDRTIGVKIHGNQLYDTFGICKDDNLIIEPEIPPRDNDLVLVCLNYEASPRGMIARLELGLDNQYRLMYNKSAETSPMPVSSVICGVVVEVKRRLVNSEIVKSRRNPKWDIWQTAVK